MGACSGGGGCGETTNSYKSINKNSIPILDRTDLACLAVLRDLPQPPIHHLQLLRQLLHLLLQAQEEGE